MAYDRDMVRDLTSLIPALQAAKKSLFATEPLGVAARLALLSRLADVWGQASEDELRALSSESNLGLELVRRWDFFGAQTWLRSFVQNAGAPPVNTFARGVISLLQPRWNGPRLLVERLAPAFVAGNSLIVKMSSHTPMATQLIDRWLRVAGIPEDLVVCIQGPSAEYSEFLIRHPAISAVSVIGRRETTLRLFQAAAVTGRGFQSWCGGRASLLQLEPLDTAGWSALLGEALREGRGQRPYDNLRVFVLEKDEATQQAALMETIAGFTDVGARLSTHLTQCSEDHQSEALGPVVLFLSIKYPFDLAKWVNNASTGFAVRINGSRERIEKLVPKLDVGLVLGDRDFDPGQSVLFGCKESIVGDVDLDPWGSFYSQRRQVRL